MEEGLLRAARLLVLSQGDLELSAKSGGSFKADREAGRASNYVGGGLNNAEKYVGIFRGPATLL
jgi:hypothetical protein